MTDDPSKRTPPPISSSDPRRTTGRYGPPREEPKTVETPALPGPLATVLAEIQESVREGFVRVNANIDATHQAIDGITDRVTRLEEIAAKSRTGPQKTFSGEVRRISENDLTQDAAIAKVITAQAATDVKVDGLIASQAKQTAMQIEIKSAVNGWVKQHPEITGGLSTLLGVIIALLTAWFQSKVH